MNAHPVVKISLLLLAAVGVIGAALFWLADPLHLRAPTDRALIAVFQEHRAAFDKLREMAAEDSVPYLSASHLSSKLSDARKQRYKDILSEIHPDLIVTVGPKAVRFIFATGGLSAISPGWLKGIEYVSGDPAREGIPCTDLDNPRSLPQGGVYLRQIEPKWFLVFQSE